MRSWVLIKGMKQDQRHWLGFERAVAARFGGHALCLDLPGAGTECERLPPWSVDEMVDDLRARWLAARDDDAPWAILGLSLGGMAALSWAARHPEDFTHVAVGNTSCGLTGRPHERLWWRAWPGVLRATLTRDAEARERVVLSMTTSAASTTRRHEVARAFARLHEERPFRGGAFARQLVAGGRFRSPARVAPPVLVLNGLGDRFVAPACSERLAARLGAELRRHPEAGHDLSLDAPEWLLEELAGWVAPP